MLVEDLKFEKLEKLPETMEELVTWGIRPLKTIAEITDTYSLEFIEEDEPLVNLHHEMQNGLERLERTLYQFINETRSALGKASGPEAQEGGDMATLTEKEILKRRLNVPDGIIDVILDRKNNSPRKRLFLLVQSLDEDDPALEEVYGSLKAAMRKNIETSPEAQESTIPA